MPPALSAGDKARLKRDGFVVLRGAVPRALVEAARREIDAGLRQESAGGQQARDGFLSYHSVAGELLALLERSPLRAAVDELLGPGRAEPVSHAQVALRFPRAPEPRRRARGHIDGLCGAPAERERYTLCAGVALSDAGAPDMGNFLAYPGSQSAIARAFAERGRGALQGGPLRAVELPAPRQLRLRAGDALLFHFQLAHDAAPNLSDRVRYMAYFRVYHVDAWRDASEDYLMRALTEPWLEWPGLEGVRAR